jgi:hypothetical protein
MHYVCPVPQILTVFSLQAWWLFSLAMKDFVVRANHELCVVQANILVLA